MKKFLFLLATIMTFCLMGCNLPWEEQPAQEDVVQPQEQVTDNWDFANPVFTNPTAVMQYQQELSMRKNIDSIFLTIPQTTINNVVSVLLSKQNPVDLAGIVYEYSNNAEIYNALPKEKSSNKDTKKEEEKEPEVKAWEECIDTVINGRKAKLQYYE